MRTAIVSDLHLGGANGEDVLREPAVRRALLEEIDGADRLVVLGDALELRDLPVGVALATARPFFEELGEALGGREVILVPGNHDHRFAEPLLDQLSLAGSAQLGLEHLYDPSPAPPPSSPPGSAAPGCASPTPASGCARTSTPPTATTWTRTSRCRAPSASPRR